MKSKILLSLLLLISLGINAGVIIVLVKQGNPTSEKPCGWHCPAMRGRYHLTPSQAEALERSRLEMMDRTRSIKNDLRLRRRVLMDLYRRDTVAATTLDSILAGLVVDQLALEKEVFQHLREVWNQLDSGQREVFYRNLMNELCPGMTADFINECPRHIK